MMREVFAPRAPAKGALGSSFLLFGAGSVLVWIAARIGVPALASRGLDSFAAWMLLSVVLVFGPVLSGAWWMLRQEGSSLLRERLWLRPLSRVDWAWIVLGVVGAGAGSALLGALSGWLGLSIDPFHHQPRAWFGSHAWMWALWLVYWPINILGEEFAWRGVLGPRLVARLGRRAWVFHGVLWGVFHAGFGLGNVLVLLPFLFVLPWMVQQRQNAWIGVALHIGISLPGMLSIAFGVM